MLKLNINNIGASETRRKPTTSTSTPRPERGCRCPSGRTSQQATKAGALSDVLSASTRRALLRVGTPSLLLLTALTASAAELTDPAATVTDVASPLQPLLDGLLGKYGWLTTVILVIGSLRILFKPVMLAIENYVKQTPGTADDERLARFEAGPIYKAIAFVLDLGASIKLPLITPPPRNSESES